MNRGGRTYVFTPILHECIAPRFPFQRSSLVEQEVKLVDLPELGEHLQESVSDQRRHSQNMHDHKCATRSLHTHSSTLGCKFPTYKRSLSRVRVCAAVDEDATGAAAATGSESVGYDKCSLRVSDVEAMFGVACSDVGVCGERSRGLVAMRCAYGKRDGDENVGGGREESWRLSPLSARLTLAPGLVGAAAFGGSFTDNLQSSCARS